MPTYRHNESDKAIDTIENAAAKGVIPVNEDGKTRVIGNPTGAGIAVYPRKNGIVGAYNDHPEVVNAKAGKKRTSDKN